MRFILTASAAALLLLLPVHAQLHDFEPTAKELVLDTDLSVVKTKQGQVTVRGGVFQFRSVKINSGVTVRGVGSNPLIFITTGDFTVQGELSVRGGDGQSVNTLNAANVPARGGRGGAAAGDGGDGSPSRFGHSWQGQPGFGPGGLLAGGGLGGTADVFGATGLTRYGSGGGGGSFATFGDPHYPIKLDLSARSFVQQIGFGGFGRADRSLLGGGPGPLPFRDGRRENDFWGDAIDVFGRRLIRGELAFPVGGRGGGGGGDRVSSLTAPFQFDEVGGGGGGGGGALVVFALGRIVVGGNGRIVADGGNGGGGEDAGSNRFGGGGGGGSGGMVVLITRKDIELHAKGETYANGDYDFVVSADGGIGLQGRFGRQPITGKYPPPASPTLWDVNTGGMGGMGIVQLMAPAGSNRDGTNTVLDDHVHVVRGATRLTGKEKQRYLAWRGWPDARGILVDDAGNPTDIGDREGDLRPTPILIPVF